MLDRVEVIEGGTSSLYGNGAMGGMISFFSQPLAPGAAKVVMDAGSRDAKHAFGAVGVPVFGAITANAAVDYLDGGGYTLLDPTVRGVIDVPSEIVQRNGFLRMNYNPSSRFSSFVTGHLFGDTRSTGTPLSRQTRDQGSVDVGLNYDADGRGQFSVRGWNGAQTEKQRSTGIRGNSTTCTPSATTPRQCEDSSVTAQIPSHDWGASLQWTKTGLLRLESFSVGGDYRHMQGNFDELDWSTTCPGANCGSFLRAIQSGGDQALSGAFVQAIAHPIAPLRVELSARVDRWDNSNGRAVDSAATALAPTVLDYGDSSKAAFSPRIGIRYQVLPRFALHAAGYKAFRAPNLAELYRKQINANASQITLPNPYLSAETALGREAGFDWQPLDWVQVKGTWYVADYENFNVPTTLTGAQRPAECGTAATCRQRLPVNKSRSEGGEAYIAIRPIEPLFIAASANYDDARVVTAAAPAVAGAHINRVPSPKQTIRATYTSRMLGTWTGIWRHEGHTTTLQGAWLDPMEVIDISGSREIVPGVRAALWIDNLQDKQYQVNVSGTAPNQLYSFGMPRTIRLGIEATRY
jgi:iron complex outermembrane receptor protein